MFNEKETHMRIKKNTPEGLYQASATVFKLAVQYCQTEKMPTQEMFTAYLSGPDSENYFRNMATWIDCKIMWGRSRMAVDRLDQTYWTDGGINGYLAMVIKTVYSDGGYFSDSVPSEKFHLGSRNDMPNPSGYMA